MLRWVYKPLLAWKELFVRMSLQGMGSVLLDTFYARLMSDLQKDPASNVNELDSGPASSSLGSRQGPATTKR